MYVLMNKLIVHEYIPPSNIKYMIKILLVLIGVVLVHPLFGQLLQLEVFVSGGSNFSQAVELAEGYSLAISPTFHAQGNVGLKLSEHSGIGAGLSYYPISSRRKFALPTLTNETISVQNSTTTFNFLPRVFVWYSFAEKNRFLPKSQLRFGLLYANDPNFSRSFSTSQYELPDGRIVYRKWERISNPSTFLALEVLYDIEIFQTGNHQLSGGIHVVKGFTELSKITHEYSIGTLQFDQRSQVVMRGDYVGLGISYRWKTEKK